MSAPLRQEESLVWGVLSFAGPPLDSEVNFEITAIAEGSHFGNPTPIIEAVQSLLIDGSQEEITGWENRDVPIRLRISANDGEALGRAEAALFRQVLMAQPDPLVWTSALGLSQTCVFDVVVARLERDTDEGWDLDESERGHRYWLLTLRCLPFARPPDSVVVPALPVPVDPEVPIWVDVDTCSATTNWTRETSGSSATGPSAVTVSGETAVRATAVLNSQSDHLRLVRNFPAPLVVPADHYLVVDVALSAVLASGGWGARFEAGSWKIHDGTAYRDPVAVVAFGGEAGATRLYFDTFATSITNLKVLNDFADILQFWTATLEVFNVAYTDTLGSSTTTTNRQQSRLVTVEGSAPTQAALRLYDATPAVLGGDMLVYTSRNTEFQPNLRHWLNDSEAPADDSSLVSGAAHTLATPTTYLIPAEVLSQGTYALLARMDVSVEGALSWQARMVHDAGTATVGSSVVISGELDLAVTTDYEIANLAAMILPVVEVESDNFMVELTLTGTADMLLDEAWLFNLDDGVLTWVRDDGNDLTWIEIRSPELGAARPSVWGSDGTLLQRAVCLDWACLSFGSHRFDPGTMQIFTVSTTSLASQCEIEYFPRFGWHVSSPETTT